MFQFDLCKKKIIYNIYTNRVMRRYKELKYLTQNETKRKFKEYL